MSEPREMIFPSLSNEAHLWIIALDGKHTDIRDLLTQTQLFLEQWTSHGRPIRSEAMLKSNRFLLVAGEIPGSTISGCGVDALMHAVEEISAKKNCRILSPMLVFYRTEHGTVDYVSRNQAREMIHQGLISLETIVFNPGIYTLCALRTGEFEMPLSDSVYARIFRIPTTIS